MSSNITSAPFNWRDHLKVHPAADLFPLMSEQELKELAEDIHKNGLKSGIILWRDKDGQDYLLDGRNRLDALALIGWLLPPRKHKFGWYTVFQINRDSGIKPTGGGPRWAAITKHCSGDPYAIALSYNIHRRHLTAEQKRELIAKLLQLQPESSDRQIGKTVKADNKTVAAVRSDMERREEIPHVETRTDTKGRKQPSKKPERTPTELEAFRERAAKLGYKVRKGGGYYQLIDMDDGQARQGSSDLETLGSILDGMEGKIAWQVYTACGSRIDGFNNSHAWLAAHPGATMEDFEQALPPAPTGCELDEPTDEIVARMKARHDGIKQSLKELLESIKTCDDMEFLAFLSTDTTLIELCVEYQMRAKRELGKLLIEQDASKKKEAA